MIGTTVSNSLLLMYDPGGLRSRDLRIKSAKPPGWVTHGYGGHSYYKVATYTPKPTQGDGVSRAVPSKSPTALAGSLLCGSAN